MFRVCECLEYARNHVLTVIFGFIVNQFSQVSKCMGKENSDFCKIL